MAIEFELNGEAVSLEVDPAMPLLWAIRDIAGLTGTKYGCGKALCGSCVVHINGQPMRSCVTPAATAAGSVVTTIEGLSEDGSHPVQVAWRELNVAQCGYCQSGQIISLFPRRQSESLSADQSRQACSVPTRMLIHRVMTTFPFLCPVSTYLCASTISSMG